MARTDYDIVYGLMTDERFVELRRRFDRELVLWPDLKDLALPEGYTREQVWDLLVAVRRQTAIELPWGSFVEKERPGRAWFTNTRALSEALSSIEARTSDASALGGAVIARRGCDVLGVWLRDDVDAALEMDGLAHPDPLDARPSALLANFYRLMGEADAYAARPLTPRALEDLYRRLTRDAVTLQPGQPAPAVRIDGRSRYVDAEYTLRTVCEIAEGAGEGSRLSPTLRVIYISWLMSGVRPLPAWNCLVDVLVRHICLRRLGFQALAIVPLSRLQLDWTSGRETHCRGFAEFMGDVEHYRNDYTSFFLLMLELLKGGVDRLETTVDQLERREAELDSRLQDDHLNHRQRSIILNAANDPTAPQRIERHRQRYRVAYATARKDFLDLVAAGYLRQKTEGRAFVFYAGERLRDVEGELPG